ncbi:MAG: CAP domain-containing protein [Anaerolineae bacterium]|nr:CAP domain-containing protein [Anaerolineae bacterium]
MPHTTEGAYNFVIQKQKLDDELALATTELVLTGNHTTPFTTSLEPIVTTSITTYVYLPLVLSPPAGFGSCLTAEESKLVNLINQYRNDNGLPSVPVSKSLTEVAQWHVFDLHENNPDSGFDHGLPCNMHSWSDQGIWSPVCYTADHAYASQMWNKPREITSNVYSGNGYENAYGTAGQATATGALNGWKSSPSHVDVILEKGTWSRFDWPAIGVGIYQHHAVLWFGEQTDPQGTVTQICDVYRD